MSDDICDEPVVKKRKSSNIVGQNKIKSQKKQPNFRLKNSEDSASLDVADADRVPLMLTNIQHLLLHSLLGNLNITEPPRWYAIDRCNNLSQTTCLIFEGVSIQHWEKYNSAFSETQKIFNHFVEILTPSVYNGSLVKELALVPLSETEKDSIIQKYGSMNLALEVRKDLMIMMKAVFPIKDQISGGPDNVTPSETFPRTQLVLSAWQLVEENYPVPLKGKLKNIYADYVMTKEVYEPVTATSPMFGLDCEMCLTSAGSELTRVSIVNEKHQTVYETLVKPYNEIINYLTKFSGMTKTLLKNVTKRLEDVQQEICDLLPPDAILVGQSLNIDLHALKMIHPYVIDTGLIYNFTGDRLRKPNLRTLAKEFLNQNIQNSKSGHCSVEDSLAALKLVQLKLSKSIEFGDAVHTNRQKYKENMLKMSSQPQYALPIFNHIIEQKKTSLVVGCDNITGDYHTFLAQAKESLSVQLKKGKSKKVKLSTVDSMEEVIETINISVNDYNLVMGHLKFDAIDDNTETMCKIDNWIRKVWDSLGNSSLFVVVFGGTTDDNGVAMINVKNI